MSSAATGDSATEAEVASTATFPNSSTISRIERLDQIEITPQRVALRRVAAEMRAIIEGLTSTSTDAAALDGIASELADIATLRQQSISLSVIQLLRQGGDDIQRINLTGAVFVGNKVFQQLACLISPQTQLGGDFLRGLLLSHAAIGRHLLGYQRS